jgi:hypothetical protein
MIVVRMYFRGIFAENHENQSFSGALATLPVCTFFVMKPVIICAFFVMMFSRCQVRREASLLKALAMLL